MIEPIEYLPSAGLKTGDDVILLILFVDDGSEEIQVMPLAFSTEELAREAAEDAEGELGEALMDWTIMSYSLNHPFRAKIDSNYMVH